MPPRAKCSKSSRDMRRVEFHLEAAPGLSVFLTGDFNNWDPHAHPMSEASADGRYKLAIRLPPGKHEYLFVIDDEWCRDPQNPDAVPNAYGSTNSVLTVKSSGHQASAYDHSSSRAGKTSKWRRGQTCLKEGRLYPDFPNL